MDTVKVNKKTVFVVAYIVVAFVAYVLFFNYNYSKFKEGEAINEAWWIARGDVNLEFYHGYVQEGFFSKVYGRNVVNVGIALIFGGSIGALVLAMISDVLSARRKPEA